MGCTGISYDFSRVSGSYATMAGSMASVAVVAVAVLFTPGFIKRETPRDAHAVTALMCAFVGLVVTTLLYSVVSGETCDALQQGRANAEEMLAAVAFGFSMLSLFYALTLLVESSRVTGNRIPLRILMGVLIPALVTLFVLVAASDVAYNQTVNTGPYSRHSAAFYKEAQRYDLLALGTFVVLSWIYVASRARRQPLRSDLSSLGNIVAVASLVVALTAAVIDELIPSSDPSWQLAPWAVRAIALVVTLITTTQGGLLCAVFGSEEGLAPRDPTTRSRQWRRALGFARRLIGLQDHLHASLPVGSVLRRHRQDRLDRPTSGNGSSAV